jgi:CRP-like cAMP-binding protein
MPTPLTLHRPVLPSGNRLLNSLPRAEYERLRTLFVPVPLPQGKVLWDAGETVRYAYFPVSGMISILSTTREGASIEVGMVGGEGMAGVPGLLSDRVTPYRIMVQLPAHALRISAAVLGEEFRRGGPLQDLLLRYIHTLLTQMSQSAACNSFHTVEQRLCRWLLVARDHADDDTLRLTQEFLSQMLGVPRTSVTTIAGRVQKLGLIRHSRGRVQIVDRAGLEAASCECYRVIRDEFARLLAA